ncbi:hypothetical protein DL546_003791 [Coniochaeta pulveracea]|uniref:F-box domain-containing protein n=1 Tax=Coniochaeta pulveracea TaxID=177199 RepID=A0A420YGX9_9PEZI|nr:hypothetical protein DL546_003791 [Coniochaeta pulveracea]
MELGTVVTAMDVEPPSPLLQLPLEIVNHLARTYLFPSDYKSLRLTARFFEPAMIRLLYRRICISKTKLDRDNFFNIAQQPHLATAVRQVVWWELAEDESVFADNPFGEDETLESDQASTYNIPDFEKLARDAFWLVSKGCPRDYAAKHPLEAAIKLYVMSPNSEAQSLARFLSAIDTMPKLITFISAPMPSEHVISTEEYNLTARVFRNECRWTCDEDAHQGLVKFLLPAMRRPESTVKHLVVAEDSGSWFLKFLRPRDTLSFQKLTHISLALASGHVSDLEDLGLCLRMATNLVELTLDMERRVDMEGDVHTTYLELDRLFGHETACCWPHLRKLEFSEIFMGDRRLGENRSTTSLVNLVSAHSASLRQLVFHGCQIGLGLLQDMAKIPGLQLSSITVSDGGRTGFRTVSEAQLLAYLNGRGPLRLIPDPGADWNTTHTIFDPETNPAEASFEASSDSSLYTDEDIRVILSNLHHTLPPRLNSELSLYTRERRSQMMSRKGSSSRLTNPRGFVTDTIPVSKWLFKHPDGSQAIGDEPLDFWSDWEDSFDDTSDDGGDDEEESATEDGVVGATDEDVVMLDGPAHSTITGLGGNGGADEGDGDSDESSVSDSGGSEFDGDDVIDNMEAPVPVMERRFQAIPLWNVLL